VPVIPNSATYQELSHSQTNDLCTEAEKEDVKGLLETLVKASDDICNKFPALCNELARSTDQPLTAHGIHNAETLSFERYKSLSQHAVKLVGNALVDSVTA
jgi:hypothetical protein